MEQLKGPEVHLDHIFLFERVFDNGHKILHKEMYLLEHIMAAARGLCA
jgi:hypothetical protein